MKSISRDDFSKAVLEAKGLVLFDVWAPFCGPCIALEPVIEEIAEEFKDSIDVVKFDASTDMDFVQELGVSGLPTFFVYKDGQVINQGSGALTKDKIKDLITPFI